MNNLVLLNCFTLGLWHPQLAHLPDGCSLKKSTRRAVRASSSSATWVLQGRLLPLEGVCWSLLGLLGDSMPAESSSSSFDGRPPPPCNHYFSVCVRVDCHCYQ